jgi:hypothetical protein
MAHRAVHAVLVACVGTLACRGHTNGSHSGDAGPVADSGSRDAAATRKHDAPAIDHHDAAEHDAAEHDAAAHHDAGVPLDAPAQHDAGIPLDAPDLCAGVTCDTPPPPTCSTTSTTMLVTYSATGTCSAGVCSYTSMIQTCAMGCNVDACVTSATDACGVCDRLWQCNPQLPPDQWSSIYDSSGLGCEDQSNQIVLRCNGEVDDLGDDMYGVATWNTTSFGMALIFPSFDGSVEIDCDPR